MFRIANNGIVTVNRGDSFELPITLNMGCTISPIPYELQPEDTLYIGIMEPNQPFEVAIVRKVVTVNDLEDPQDIIVYFTPEDTECLLPGKYYYQVKMASYDCDSDKSRVETVVDKTLFYIQE